MTKLHQESIASLHRIPPESLDLETRPVIQELNAWKDPNRPHVLVLQAIFQVHQWLIPAAVCQLPQASHKLPCELGLQSDGHRTAWKQCACNDVIEVEKIHDWDGDTVVKSYPEFSWIFCIDGSVIDLACQIGVDGASGTTQSWSDCCSASPSLIWHCGICLYFGLHKNKAWHPQLVLRPSSLGLQNANCKLFPVLNSSAKHWVSWVIPLLSSAAIHWASRTTWKTRRHRPPAPEVPGPGGDGWDLWLDEVGWGFDLVSTWTWLFFFPKKRVANEWLKKHIQKNAS